MKTAAEWAKCILPCICDQAYTSRGLVQPDCPLCQYGEEVEDALKAYALQVGEAVRETDLKIVNGRATAAVEWAGDKDLSEYWKGYYEASNESYAKIRALPVETP